MKIIHGGKPVKIKTLMMDRNGQRSLEKSDRFSIGNWWQERELADIRTTELMDRYVREGTITDDEGTPLSGAELERVRHRLLGTFDGMPGLRSSWGCSVQEQRWVILGLWPFGTIPVLGGNPKAGKTELAMDLTASLIRPAFRFLDYFGPSQLVRDELSRGIMLVNAETPAADFDRELLRRLDVPKEESLGLKATRMVDVVHLEHLGGPQMFDLTDPAIYDWWANEIIQCEDCEGTDDWSPIVVIVDGLTAILGGTTARYGEWYAAFRRLMRSLDIPNALVIGHNTMEGSHLMGGVEAQAGADGLWSYSAANPDNPTSARRFSVRPRLGGVAVPPMEVRMVEGRLVARKGEVAMAQQTGAESGPDEVLTVARGTADYVREHPGADGQELTDNVESRSKEQNLEGRAKAVELGLIRDQQCGPDCSVCIDRRPHHNRRHYWPVDEAVESVID